MNRIFFKLLSTGVQDYNQTSLQLVLKNPNFKPANSTVLYFYGLTNTPATPNIILMRDAYVNAGYNFLMFDVNSIDYTYLVSF